MPENISAEHISAEHISVEELADQAEQLLDVARADAVRTHLAGCPICTETARLLAALPATLAAEPAPAMPPAVVSRLDQVLAEEQARRVGQTLPPPTAGLPGAAGRTPTAGSDWTPRARLEPNRVDLSRAERPRRGRTAGWVLAAAGLATLVGFAGYVVSARAGLNEPPTGSAALSSNSLPQQANALENTGAVDPHRFSHAWSCAREVTDGRITGLASVTVDGSPALLVYLHTDDQDLAAVVHGCDTTQPQVVRTIRLTR